MKFMDINKYLNILKSMIHSVESEINRLFRPDKNESPVFYTRFRLRNLLCAVMLASNKIFRYIRLLNNSDKTNTDFFQSRSYTVSRLDDEKIFILKTNNFYRTNRACFSIRFKTNPPFRLIKAT
jgi:hypothetical protein